jgi:hypothetical protein
MDKVTETLVQEFVNEQGLTALKESKQFEHFATFIAVRGEHSETFSTNDLVVGDDEDSKGGTDTGIDAVAIIVNGVLLTDIEELDDLIDRSGYLEATFIFVQAETSSSFDGAKIGTFGFGVTDFFRDAPKLKRNEKVSSAAEIQQAIYAKSSKFRRGNPVCKLFYVTTGKWAEDDGLKARIDAIKTDLSDTGRFSRVDFTPLGASGVQRRYQQSRHAVSAEFIFANKVTIPDVPNVTEAYSGFLPWPEFRKLIEDEEGTLLKRLFFDNVRDWLGYNGVNLEIKNTLGSPDPRSRFVLMNNGVTIIAKTVRSTANKFTVEDYQIVNGCQTCHVLYDQRSILDNSVSIPVRLISTKDENVTKAITKATNWQTAITQEQLFALEEFPKALELYFTSHAPEHRLYFERRSRQYESAAIEKKRVISFDSTIKAFAGMFLNEPHRTTRNYKGIKARLGTDLFAKDQRMEPYYAAALAYFRVESLFNAKKLDARLKPARFHIMLALRIMIAGYERPAFTANKMEGYCRPIIEALQESVSAEKTILEAAEVAAIATKGDYGRDNIRTEGFTTAISAEARKWRETAVKAS